MSDPKIAAALLKQRPELKIPTVQNVQQEGGVLDFIDPGPAAGFMSEVSGIGNPGIIALIGSLIGGGPEDLLKLGSLPGKIKKASKTKKAQKLPFKNPEDAAGFVSDALRNLSDISPGAIQPQQFAEEVATKARKRLDELAPAGTIFGDLGLSAPRVTGAERSAAESGAFPKSGEVTLGTVGEDLSLDDFANIFNHEEFHVFWQQLGEKASQGDEAAQYTKDVFSNVLGKLTGFRRQGDVVAETLTKAGRTPNVDLPHTTKAIPNIGQKLTAEVLDVVDPADKPAILEQFVKAADIREGERTADVLPNLLTPEGRANLPGEVLDMFFGILNIPRPDIPGFQRGGQVDANAVLQFLLQGLI